MVFGGWVVSALKWVSESWSARGKERDRLALFRGVSVAHGGETIHVVWDGPLTEVTELQAPRIMTAELRTALEHAICAKGVNAQLDTLDSPKSIPVFETDEKKTWKKKLKGPPGPDGRFYLKVFP